MEVRFQSGAELVFNLQGPNKVARAANASPTTNGPGPGLSGAFIFASGELGGFTPPDGWRLERLQRGIPDKQQHEQEDHEQQQAGQLADGTTAATTDAGATAEAAWVAFAPADAPMAYQVLLRASLEGGRQHFVRLDEVLESWRVWSPLLGQLAAGGVGGLELYEPGEALHERPTPATAKKIDAEVPAAEGRDEL